jgi:hypothetical protein
MCGVENALLSNKLTLTALGRASQREAKVKNKIKQMDRLLGNENIHAEINDYYRAIAHLVIGNKKHPIILVDWASVDNRNKYHMLKASVAYDGRAITILDRIELKDRPREIENNCLDKFVDDLAKILPAGCQPIIVTDAGFVAKWFMRIEAKNWYWVGRLRGLTKIGKSKDGTWLSCQDLFQLATGQPKEHGDHLVTKAQKLNGSIVLYKKPKKNRVRKNKDGSRKASSKKEDYERAANEPWILATNLPKTSTRAKKVVKCYEKRMQIEETIRDTKSTNYGFGIRYTLSEYKERIAVLLLISVLALLVLCVLGKVAYEKGIYKDFQANTITNRKVLSLWYLGRQIYEHKRHEITIKEFQTAARNIFKEIQVYEICCKEMLNFSGAKTLLKAA